MAFLEDANQFLRMYVHTYAWRRRPEEGTDCPSLPLSITIFEAWSLPEPEAPVSTMLGAKKLHKFIVSIPLRAGVRGICGMSIFPFLELRWIQYLILIGSYSSKASVAPKPSL